MRSSNKGAVGAMSMTGSGVFNNPNYKSTNVSFKGQDKSVNP